MNRDVPKSKLVTLDFNNIAFKIGAESANCQGRWTEFDEQDMRILFALLTKNVMGQGSAAESSESLNILAQFCAAGIQWFQRQKDVVVDDRFEIKRTA